jgi:methyl-accepting chemotaxis protein
MSVSKAVENRGVFPILLKMMGVVFFILMAGFFVLYAIQDLAQEEMLYVGFGLVFLMACAIVFSVYYLVLFPVIALSRRIAEITESGDISRRINGAQNDVSGLLVSGLNRFSERFSEVIPKTTLAAQKVISASSDVVAGSRNIMQGAAVQVDAIESTLGSIREMNVNIQGIAGASKKLASSSKESMDAVYQMSSAVEDITKNTTFLGASVDEASVAILSMSSEIRKIDERVDNLLAEAESTSASMIEMDQSLKGTRMNIMEMVELAQEVNAHANMGRRKVEVTRDNIHGIKNYSRRVYEAVRNLEKQTGNIGRFLDVIDDMADQTNLLALNAEIIAAQEGEHGRSFSVVANEIKELAERTAASTHEIHEIIKALQSEARVAVETIESGSMQIDEGVAMSRSTQEALDKIYDSINRSTQRTSMIANTMEEQSNVVRHVGMAMLRVNEMVHDIAKATNEQNNKSEKIIEVAYRMKSITESLQGAMAPHEKGMKKVKEGAEVVSKMARDIAEETEDQDTQSGEIVRAIEQMKTVTYGTVETMGAVGNSVEALIKEARLLETDILNVRRGR